MLEVDRLPTGRDFDYWSGEVRVEDCTRLTYGRSRFTEPKNGARNTVL